MPVPRRLPLFRSLTTSALSVALVLGLTAPSAMAATAPPTPEPHSSSTPEPQDSGAPEIQSPVPTPSAPTPTPTPTATPTPTDAPTTPAPAPESAIEVAVTGPLFVLAAEGLDPGSDERIVVLQASGGSLLQLEGVEAAAVEPGDEFSGVVAIDASVAADPSPQPEQDGVISADSAEGQELLAQSVAAQLPVAAVESTITPAADPLPDATVEQRTVAGTVPARAHTLDVAIVGTSQGATSYFSDAQANALVSEMSGYWASQSQGAVSTMTKPRSVKRVTVTDPCNPYSVWTAAAAAFGVGDLQGVYTGGTGRHLVVIATPLNTGGCTAGNGLGSVGASVHEGGVLWASVAGPDAASVVGHELGHNIGLGHSNTHYCSNAAVVEGLPDASGAYSNDCYDNPYRDYYDIMAGGFSACSTVCYTMNKITALNVAHKASVGFLDAASMPNLSLPTAEWSSSRTITLQAASSSSGVRGLRLVNPRDGGVYFVEWRNGTGLDAGGFYTTPAGGGNGVRVLRLGSDYGPASRVLAPVAASGTSRNYRLDPGEKFTTADRGITIAITTVTASAATLSIQLNRAMPFASVGDPSLSAVTAGYGKAITVTAGTATPAATGTTYQWLSNGAAITGATASTYTPVLADVGKRLSARVTLTRSGYIPSTRTTAQTSAVTGPVVKRVYGSDRYNTAVALSKLGYPGTAPVVYVATGANFPDALAAAPAAATLGGPLLLSAVDKLPATVKTEIQRLKPARIVVVGGAATVSDAVLRELKALQKNTVRLAGVDRFATANAIIRDAFPGTVRESWMATGLNFPDALSAAGVAGSRNVPVVMVNGALPTVDAATATLLAKLQPSTIAIAGSTGVISAGMESALKKKYAVTRYAGADRYATSEAVNATTFTNPKTVYLATGLGFADALAGAAIAGATDGPLYVIPPGCVPGGVLKKISAWGSTRVIVIGGPTVLSPAVEKLTRC